MSRLAGGQSPANVMRFLQAVRFPARKDEIAHAARQAGAPNDIVGALERLPVNDFESPEQLLDALPKIA